MNFSDRQNNEMLFYDTQDDLYDKDIVYDNFEKITAIENIEALKEMGGKENLKEKKILDIGCGIGDTAVYFALQGAKVYGTDISPKMISIAKTMAQNYGVNDSCKFFIGPAEKIDFSDDNFDFIFGNGILHHTDIEPAIKEIHRVLKKNGKAVFIEPLAYNPIIKIYRKLAYEIRSKDEKPLTISDFKIINKYFKKMDHKEFWLLSLYIFVHFYLTGHNPNKVKYWKKVIKDASKYESIYKPLKFMDDIILKIFPLSRLLCWTTVIKLTK